MSNSVDNRVVSMEFDNAKFERNVAQSLETLKHLDKSLDGLTNSSKKFDGVSFEDLANSIDSIANRFTLMGRITQKVFDDIASGIVNLGKKMVNDFAIEPITSGWDKYAEKTTSVQTIMNATGESIDFVEEQLSRLNRFTDETSYNFSDMTSNIAKFTSQGIELDTAVTQMQGIATWAASAGQNAQAASRAMYNISQAMGAGSMKLIDWKSIQNANMATKEFKEQAIQAGIAAGTLVEQEGKIVTATGNVEVSAKNFEQTLQKGWFNTEAMQKVFTDYGKFADTVDEIYESFDENFSVSKLMQWSEELDNVGDSAEDAATFQKKLAKESGLTGQELDDLIESLKKLNSEELKFSRETYKAAQEAKTFGDAVDATKDAVSTAWMNVFQTIFGNYEEARHLWTDMANWWYDIFAEPVNALQETLDHVMSGSRMIKKASNAAYQSVEWTGRDLLFGNDKEKGRIGALYDIMDTINTIGDSISSAWGDIFNGDKEETIRNALEGIKRFTQGIKDAIGGGEKLRSTFKGVFAVLDIGKTAFSSLFNGMKSIISLFLPTNIGILGITSSIGDWLVGIRDSIKENQVFEKAMGKVVGVFGSFRKSLDPFINRVNDLWSTFQKNDGVKQTASFFSNAFTVAINGATTVVQKLAEGFNKLTIAVTDFYDKYLAQYVGKIVEFFAKLANGSVSIISVFNNVKSAIVDFFTILFNFIKNRDYEQFVTDLTNRFSGMVTAVQGLGTKLLNGLQWLFGIDKSTALTIIKLSAALFGFVKVLNLLKRLTSIRASFVGFLDSLSSSIKAFVRNYKVNTVLKIAASIGILAASLVVLSRIPADDLARAKDALIAIGVLFGIITAIVTAGSILGKPEAAQGIGQAMIGFAASMAVAIAAIWVLTNKVDYSKIWQALGTLFALMTFVAASMIVVSRHAKKAATSAATMLGFSAAILVMVYALEKIQNSSDTIKPDAFSKLFAIILALTLAAAALRNVRFSSALGVILFVASLTLLQKMLKKFLDEALPAEQLLAHIDKFIVVVGMLLALAAVSRVAGGGGLKMAVTMIAIIGSIYVLAQVAAQIGVLPLAQLAKGTAVILALGLMVGAVIWLMNTALVTGGINKGFTTSVIALVAAMIALGLELIVLSAIPWSNILRGMAAIGTVMLGMAAVCVSIGYMSKTFNSASLWSILEIVTIIAAVSAALITLNTKTDPNTVMEAAKALGLTMVALAGALALIGTIKFNKVSLADVGKIFLESVAVLVPAVVALYALNNINTDGLITKVAGLSILLVTLSGSLLLLSAMKPSANVLQNVGALTLATFALIVLVYAMKELNNVEVDGLIEKVGSLSILLLALTASVAILGSLPAFNFGAAIGGLTAMILGIGEAALLCAGMGYIQSEFENFGTWVTTGAEILGEAIGKFVGALVGGLISGAAEALADLDTFADDLGKVAEKLKMFDDSAIAGAKAMAGLLLALGAAEVATAIENILGGWFTKLIGADLGSQLVKFADAVVQYTNKVKELDEGDVSKVARITNAMSNLLKALPSEGGLLDLFTGSKSQGMANLKTNLGGENGFGAAIKSFVVSCRGVTDGDINTVTRVKTIVESLGSMMESIGKSGGLVQDFMGESNIAKFGTQILSFIRTLVGGNVPGSGASEGIIELAKKIPEDTSSLDRIKAVTESLSSAIEGIPTLGGFVDKLLGSDDPSVFGQEIQTYIDQLVEIGKKAQNLTPEMVSGIKRLSEASAAMTAYNGASGGVEEPPIEASKKAVEVAKNTDEAVNIMANANTTAASENAQDVSGMFGFIKNLFGDNGTVDTSKLDLSNVAQTMVSSLSSGFSANSDMISTAGQDLLGSFMNGFTGEGATATVEASTTSFFTNFTTGLSGKTEEMKSLGSDFLTSFTSGFSGEGSAETVSASADGIVTGILTALGSKTEDIKTAATGLLASFVEGFSGEGAIASIKAGAETIITSAVDTLTAAADRAKTSGGFFGEGFAQGIRDKLEDVKTAAAELAEAASEALDLAAQIKSPSRVARRSGGFFGEGFGLGIKDMFGYVSHQAEGLSNVALDAVSVASELASSIIESGADPVITPVLDLSEVRNGVRSISNLGSFRASVSANTVGAVSMARDDMLASKIQNGTPAPVTAVLSDSAARALAGSRQTANKTVIEFTGDLAQLARVLHPVIVDQYNYHGDKLIK